MQIFGFPIQTKRLFTGQSKVIVLHPKIIQALASAPQHPRNSLAFGRIDQRKYFDQLSSRSHDKPQTQEHLCTQFMQGKPNYQRGLVVCVQPGRRKSCFDPRKSLLCHERKCRESLMEDRVPELETRLARVRPTNVRDGPLVTQNDSS